MNQNFIQDDNTLNTHILEALSENNIQNFLIQTTSVCSEESFFIKKENVLNRGKYTIQSNITVFHDFNENEKDYRGSFTFTANLNMTADELSKKVANAYQSARSVKNPYYKLPSGSQMFSESDSISVLSENGKVQKSMDIAQIIYENDTHKHAFINSLEVFINHTHSHIINSNGINVSFEHTVYTGEFVVQSTFAEDVELYRDFKYSSKDEHLKESLSDFVTSALDAVYERSVAKPFSEVVKEENYHKIILTGSCLYDLFNYYLTKSDASMIYPGYSKYSIGTSIASDNTSDKISMTLAPNIPYSEEGIELKNLAIIRDNKVQFITGNAMYASYLGIQPTGTYNSFHLAPGTTSLETMKSEPYLMVSDFSDFQMDEFTGAFGGEFRLAYYFDGKQVTPVTAGSVNGNINDIQELKLSSETRTSYHYEGPVAVSYKK